MELRLGPIWKHCNEHNIDYPERDGCPFCNGTLDYEEFLVKQRTHVSGLRYAYWRIRAKLSDWLEYINFKISEWEEWTEYHSKAM